MFSFECLHWPSWSNTVPIAGFKMLNSMVCLPLTSLGYILSLWDYYLQFSNKSSKAIQFPQSRLKCVSDAQREYPWNGQAAAGSLALNRLLESCEPIFYIPCWEECESSGRVGAPVLDWKDKRKKEIENTLATKSMKVTALQGQRALKLWNLWRCSWMMPALCKCLNSQIVV